VDGADGADQATGETGEESGSQQDVTHGNQSDDVTENAGRAAADDTVPRVLLGSSRRRKGDTAAAVAVNPKELRRQSLATTKDLIATLEV
jgi:uncharacterized ferritin-like protein (DUF455 family)